MSEGEQGTQNSAQSVSVNLDQIKIVDSSPSSSPTTGPSPLNSSNAETVKDWGSSAPSSPIVSSPRALPLVVSSSQSHSNIDHKTSNATATASSPASVETKRPDGDQSRDYEADEHFLSLSELSKRYETQLDLVNPRKSRGITLAMAGQRLETYGKNKLTPPKETPEIIKFLLNFTDPFMIVLIIAGSFCFLAWGIGNQEDKTNAILGAVLYIVVVITCIMTYLQSRQTSSVTEMFAKMLPAQCTIIRDGKESRIAAENLVIGDIVKLNLGDRIPADMRLIDVKDLKVEMSSMTGEPDAITCFVEKQHDLPNEARNLVFNSALVMNGEGVGVVIRTGDNTMIGKIAKLASTTTAQRSNMENEVLHFVHQVTKIAIATSIIFFTIGAARVGTREGTLNAFINGFILVMVAFVPEGLPATVATCLTIAAQRMAARRIFIKRPDIIEALGAATVIASDKTGTLTQNKMTVENMWVNKGAQNVRVRPNHKTSRDIPALDTISAMSVGRVIGSQDLEGITTIIKSPSASRSQLSSTDLAINTTNSTGAFTQDEPAGSIGRVNNSLGRRNMGTYASFSSFLTFQKRTIGSGGLGGGGGLTHVSWDRSSPYMRLVIMSGVCNRARFSSGGEEDTEVAVKSKSKSSSSSTLFKKERKVLGDASDAALLRFVDGIIPIEELRLAAFPTVFEIPFNSVNKWSMAVVKDPGVSPDSSKSHVAMLKGAPEVILSRCSTYLHNGKEKDIDEDFQHDFQQAYEQFAYQGERVLGFAYKTFKGEKDATIYQKDDSSLPKENLVFLGLVSLVDPPRDGVAEAVEKCRSADIRVTMVTGDHPLTAEAIARKVGIITQATQREVAAMDGVDEHEIPLSDPRVRAVVRAGPEIKGLTQEQWDEILTKDECVFARTTPQQKLEIVENYQRLGHVVAVTGDGVNDSPALKKANIGVAMGSAEASDVAREAADIILMDDNFASIVSAIEEGRVLFDNLKKSIAYTIAHTVPELFPLLLNLWFGLPLPLPGLVLLTIDLLSEQGPAISFAYEKAEDSIMARPPRRMGVDMLVSRQVVFYSYVIAGLASSLTCFFAYCMVYINRGIPISKLWLSGDYFLNPVSTTQSPDMIIGNKVFTSQMQWDIYTESVSAWYATIIANQFWHVFLCKTRIVSIFEHGFFGNPVTIGGVACALFTAVFFVYVPGVQPYFFTNNLFGAIWLCSGLFALVMGLFTEHVKSQVRKHPDSFLARQIAW
jgi:magnesium-transporting ATPase (P-type)